MMAKRNNENYSPYASAGTKSPKAFLLASVIAAFCADLCVSVLLIYSAAPVLYWIFPVLALAADALFLLGAVFTNFRFKYSVGEICAYVVFICAIAVAENVVNFTGEIVTLSVTAAAMWTASHALSLVCTVAACVHASKVVKGNKIAKIVVAALFCALAAACALFYGLYVLGDGFFGQGGYDLRAPEYTYNEADDSYSVTGVMQGRGGTIVVPEEFNGKKVGAVSYKVFNAEGITDVNMMTADVKFTDAEELAHFDGDINIYAEKEDAEKLRKSFFNMRNTTFRAYDLANSVVPAVDADEVYITFAYDADSYNTVNGNVLPIWTGKKGETFNLSDYAEKYTYVKYTSASDEEGLYLSYIYFDKKVLKEISASDGAALARDGARVEESRKVNVEFENVYRIKVQDDNDTKYEPAAGFKSVNAGGINTGYRYAVAGTYDNVLNELKTSREGFTLSYKYGSTATESPQNYSDFGTTLSRINAADNTFYMYPVWKLNAPEITEFYNSAEGKQTVYGEELEIRAEAKAPVGGMNIAYNWSGAVTANGAGFTIEHVRRGKGTYTLTVTASGENTSLTSTATKTVEVTVSGRPVYLGWTGAETEIYDGNDHYVSYTVNAATANSGIVYGDNVSVALNASTVSGDKAVFRNAGTYSVTATLTGLDSENYYFGNASFVNKTIEQAPLNIVWGKSDFVYDKTVHAPEYEVTGGIGAEDTKVSIDGATMYANAYTNNQYHVATAVTSNHNYYITAGTRTHNFTVAQRELTIVWTGDAITYSGGNVAPLPELPSTGNNVMDGDTVQLSASGYQRYTNDYTGIPKYTATAVIGNRNYKATATTATKEFTVIPRPVSFVWDSAASFEYNGSVQYLKVTNISNAVAGELNSLLASVTYTGGGKDVAGGSYTAYATLANKNYSVEESSRVSGSYTIAPKPVTVTFTSSENVMPYMATIMTPTHSVWGEIVRGEAGIELDGRGENVGDYTITPRVTNPNYTVTSAPFKYSITPAPVILDWGTAALTYNGKTHSPEPTVTSKIYSRGEGLGLSWVYSRDEAGRINNCEFTATASITNPNYEITEGKSQTFGINPIWLEVVWKNTNLVYNGSAQAPTAEIKDKSLIVAGDTLELIVSGSGTETGEYTATASLKSDTSAPAVNYRLYSETRTVKFTISAAVPQPAAFIGKKFGAEGGSL